MKKTKEVGDYIFKTRIGVCCWCGVSNEEEDKRVCPNPKQEGQHCGHWYGLPYKWMLKG